MLADMVKTTARSTRRDSDGQAIVFDATAIPQVTPQWFEPSFWQAQSRLRARTGGRGTVGFIDGPAGPMVLRHFRRGGALAPIRGDRYLWLGAQHSRSFREFALLQRLRAMDLPVPEPLAARCVRHGVWARADLLSVELPGAETLAEMLAAGRVGEDDWRHVGSMLARFHAAGVDHADLNAHNIVLAHGGWNLLDFDRGRLRKPAARWQRRNLSRLLRSIRKVAPPPAAAPDWLMRQWQVLLDAYRRDADASMGMVEVRR